MKSKAFKKATRTWTEYKHIFAIVLLVNAATIFWGLQAVATSWINEDDLCGSISEQYETFYNVSLVSMQGSGDSLSGVAEGVNRITEAFTDVIQFLVLWKIRNQLGAYVLVLNCAVDSLGSIDGILEQWNKLDDMLNDFCLDFESPFGSWCEGDGELCMKVNIPRICGPEICVSVPYGPSSCYTPCTPSYSFGPCASFEVPSIRLTAAGLGLGSVADESINNAILETLYDRISDSIGEELISFEYTSFDFDFEVELLKFRSVFINAEASCRKVVSSDSVQETKDKIDFVLFLFGLICMILAVFYPFVVTAVTYAFYTCDSSSALKKKINNLVVESKEPGLPFKAYIGYLPTIVSLLIGLAALGFIIGLYLANLYIEEDFQRVIDEEIRVQIQVFEDSLISDLNDSLEDMNVMVFEFLENLDNSTITIAEDLQLLFDDYNDIADEIKDTVPIFGAYAVNILECIFGFLTFDDIVDHLTAIRSKAIVYLREILTIEITSDDVNITNTMIAHLQSSRESFSETMSTTIYQLTIRCIPLWLAFPLLVLQGLIFELRDCLR